LYDSLTTLRRNWAKEEQMRSLLRPLSLALAVFFLATFGEVSAARAAANRQTAREALDQAGAKAKQWHADAELIELGADVDDKGTADNGGDTPGGGWSYTFRSPSAKKRLYLYVYAGGFSTQEAALTPDDDPASPQALKPLPASFVDSDQVMAEARNNGFSGSTGRYTVDLSDTPRGGNLKESLCWVVMDNGSFFYVSATSGKLLKKLSTGQ
jgi:hypothetical protein